MLMECSRVILVDDNRRFLDVLQEYLREFEGIEVVGTATSAQEAMGLVNSANPHLLIVDLSMPDMNGLDFTQQVKSRWPHLPTIVLTLFDTPRHRQAALEAGADAFVGKAHMDSDLLPTIRGLLTRPGVGYGTT